MKILLIGEYSRLHNSLKEGLVALGHDVKIVGTGDYFKGYPVDFSIAPKVVSPKLFWRVLNKIVFTLFNTDFYELEKGWRFKRLLPQLKDYDVVQLINSDAIETLPGWQIKMHKKLFAQNKKKFLLVCGEDTPIVDELFQNRLRYSILTPYFKNPELKEKYRYTLKYITKPYRKLYDFIAANADGILVSDLDYKIPMDLQHIKNTFIPNPVNVDKIAFLPNAISGKIIIFHGINNLSKEKKGNHFFEKALQIISDRFPEKIELISASNMPYHQYIELYDKAHILLDQVYGYDQGYNALEAMAKGTVVFTGAETEFYEHFKLLEAVNVNAVPDVDQIVEKLSFLIENPDEILKTGKNARAFIEQHHHYRTIAKKYVQTWIAKKNPEL